MLSVCTALQRAVLLLLLLAVATIGTAQDDSRRLQGMVSYTPFNTATAGVAVRISDHLSLAAAGGYVVEAKSGGHYSWGPWGPVSGVSRRMAFSGPVAQLGVVYNKRELGQDPRQIRGWVEFQQLSSGTFIEDTGVNSGSNTSEYSEFSEEFQSIGLVVQRGIVLFDHMVLFAGGGLRQDLGTRSTTVTGTFGNQLVQEPPIEETINRVRPVVQLGITVLLPGYRNR